MGQPVTRVGDTGVGVCPNHSSPVIYTTTFNKGSPTVSADGKPVVRVGDTGTSTCGHPTTAMTGSGLTTADGLKIHRVGDTGQNFGTYTVQVGSPTVTSD